MLRLFCPPIPITTLGLDQPQEMKGRRDLVEGFLRRLGRLVLGGRLLLCPMEVQSQSLGFQGITLLGSPAEDRLRVEETLGLRTTRGFLLRTPSRLLEAEEEPRQGRRWGLTFLAPSFHLIWNSDLPFSFNDGALWAGRGVNVQGVLGFRLQAGPAILVAAPEWVYSENRPFQVIPYPPAGRPPRNYWANSFHPLPESLDLPSRFGDRPLATWLPGQSSVAVRFGPVVLGGGTENIWWGPGIRNAILLSNHAEGFPHLFLRTGGPWSTPLGRVEAHWFLGRLRESDFFDEVPDNDLRSLNGMAVTIQPSFDPGLTLGAARVVLGSLEHGSALWRAALDVFKSVGRPGQKAWDIQGDPWGIRTPLPEVGSGKDQIFGLFARWTFPDVGFDAWAEWARFEEPGGIRDFLQFPQHSQGYTVGLQWVGGGDQRRRLRVQGEITNLEPASTWRHRKTPATYSSRAVPQGYTHRGQVIGAAIGPGASSQWLAFDLLHRRWQVGGFLGRIRWDAGAQYLPVVVPPKREDVSLFWGVRGGVESVGWLLNLEVGTGVRINYLFQTFQPDPATGRAEGVDVANTTVRLSMSKVPRRGGA